MRWFVVCMIAVLIALLGVRAATVEPGLADLLLSVTIGSALALSCFADARSLGEPLPSGAGFAIFALWPIAVPIYFLSSRGLRRGGLLAIGILVAQLAIYFGAYTLASHVVWGGVVF